MKFVYCPQDDFDNFDKLLSVTFLRYVNLFSYERSSFEQLVALILTSRVWALTKISLFFNAKSLG